MRLINSFIQRNKFFFNQVIFFIALFFVISCSDQGCIEADDYGDVESQTLLVYTNNNQTTCEFDSSKSYEDQSSTVLKSCLTTSIQNITDSDETVFSSTTGCAGFIANNNAKIKNLCEQGCINKCQSETNNSTISQPSWVATTPKSNNSSYGVNISPNSQITITAKGNINLGKNIELSTKHVNPQQLLPNSYTNTSYVTESVLDVSNGQSITLKFAKNSTTSTDGTPLTPIDFSRRLVAYVIPHPQNYKYNYSQANPTLAPINVPLMPRFNGWKCVYTSDNFIESTCSYGFVDNYSSDTNGISSQDIFTNTNNDLASESFNVDSKSEKITNYGGFIRWDNDNLRNYSYDPFVNTSCTFDGVCTSIPNSNEGIIIGDLSTQFNYINNDTNAKELSFKLLGSYCTSITISKLSIIDKSNREIYYVNNFRITNSTYSTKKIPLDKGNKLILTANSTSVNTINCGKHLAMRMLKYHDIFISTSGFASFRIIDHNSIDASKNSTCTALARIINPKGTHPVINDSSITDGLVYNLSSLQFILPMPPLGSRPNVEESFYGTETLDVNGNFLRGSSACSVQTTTNLSNVYQSCMTSNSDTCIKNFADLAISPLNGCPSGIGPNGSENSNPQGGGSGGAGGGNIQGESFAVDLNGYGKAGTYGHSYSSNYYNSSISYSSSGLMADDGKKGELGMHGGNGKVIIYDCDDNYLNCNATPYSFIDTHPYYQDYTIPANRKIKYEIVGGGGGSGGNSCGTVSQFPGGNGSASLKFSGSLANISSSQTPKLRIYVGGAGNAGYSQCNKNFISQIIYNNILSTPIPSMVINAPSGQVISKVNFASYGLPKFNSNSNILTRSLPSDTHQFAVNSFCNASNSKITIANSCIGQSSCTIALNNASLDSATSNCKNGNGSDGTSSTSTPATQGSGGGAGGGNGTGGASVDPSIAGIISGGAIGQAGATADSFYEPYFHLSQTAPTITTSTINKGINSVSGSTITSTEAQNGYAKINSSTINQLSPTTIYYNSTTNLTYEIQGGGGGAGGNIDSTKLGGNGANGAKLTGTLQVNSGDTLRIDVGEKGKRGASVCNITPLWSIFKFEGDTVNLSLIEQSKIPTEAYYGSFQRNASRDSVDSFAINSFCQAIDVKNIINSNLSQSSFAISNANFSYVPSAGTCLSGNGSSALSASSYSNTGGSGGGGGGNGFGGVTAQATGAINAGSTTSGSSGQAGQSADSFINQFFHTDTIPSTAIPGSAISSDGTAIIKTNNSSGTSLVNITTPSTSGYKSSITIANDVTKIYYQISGAGGGNGSVVNPYQASQSSGAQGASFSGFLNVKPGDIVEVFTGKAGTSGSQCGDVTHISENEFSKMVINSSCPIHSFLFANYGQPNTDTTPYRRNASCTRNLLAFSYCNGQPSSCFNINSCIGQTSCTINATNLTLGGDPCPPAFINRVNINNRATAGATVDTSSTHQNTYSGTPGGAGGGYNASSGGLASYNQNTFAYDGAYGGSSGSSFRNTIYNTSTTSMFALPQTTYTASSQNDLSSNGENGSNGSVKVCQSYNVNCQTFSTPGVYEYTVPATSSIYYEVSGGSGGSGGCSNFSNGGQGAGGTKITGYTKSITQGDIIYIYVGGGGGGGFNAEHKYRGTDVAGGVASINSQYFLGANGGNKITSPSFDNSYFTYLYLSWGGAGGSASFIAYKGKIVVLASGGGGGGGAGNTLYTPVNSNYYSHGRNAVNSLSIDETDNSNNFIYNFKKLAIAYQCISATTKGIGGSVSSASSTYFPAKAYLSGGDGGETIASSSCSGGGGGGGGGGTMIAINGEIVAIAGGGGGGGGNNSTTTGDSAYFNSTILQTLKISPGKNNLLIYYYDKIFEPATSVDDKITLGGISGGVVMDSQYQRYCTQNSVGQGGGGGGATVLSVNNRVIAIASGGGGGAGAGTSTSIQAQSASENSTLLDKLKVGPFGKYLAVNFETRTGSAGILNTSTQTSGNFLVNSIASGLLFNDVISTNFNASSTCTAQSDSLKSQLEENCLYRNSCINSISLSSLAGTGLCLTPSSSAIISYHTPIQGFSPAKNASILKGGDGGKSGAKECSGGGGAGGGASAISVLANSNYSSASEHFVAISGGGGGGGGASCDGSNTSNSNSINPDSSSVSNTLKNTSLGLWLTARISFPRLIPKNIPEDYYEYDDFSIPTNDSTDPLRSLSVNQGAFVPLTGTALSSNKIFLRKGQIIRFSPETWGYNWITKNNLTRQCGIGMVMQVEPRPALICAGKRRQAVLNPNCLQEVDLSSSASSGSPLGCEPDNITATNYCNDQSHLCSPACYKKIVCTGIKNDGTFGKTGCSISGDPEITGSVCTESSRVETICSISGETISAGSNCAPSAGVKTVVTKTFNTTAFCNECNNRRLLASMENYYIIGDYDNCYDLEEYKGKISNIVNNQNNQNEIENLINNKNLKYLNGFNGVYGNLENFIISSENNYESKYPLNSSLKGRMKFLLVDGYDLNVPSDGSQYINFYNNNSGIVNLTPSISLSARNGEWLQVRLCKENSNSSNNCKILDMPSANNISNGGQSSNPKVVDISAISAVAFDAVNYNFDTNGSLVRTTDPIVNKDCNSSQAQYITDAVSGVSTILDPAKAITTNKGSKFYCHNDQSSESLLRLSFKILDPEIEDCNMKTGLSTEPLNGVRMKNVKYNSQDAANINATCTLDQSSDCAKEFICVDKYSNNTGFYVVKVKIKNNRGISQLVNNIVEPITVWMDGNPSSSNVNERVGLVEKLYISLINNPKYQLILNLSLVLFIMFYGLGYLMGVSELSQAQITIRAFKIGFIYLFVGPTGWVWFKAIFVNIFKEGILQASFLMASAFDNSTQIEEAIRTGNYQSTAMLFNSVDNVISIIFSPAVNKKIWAFLFTGIFGWAYILVFYFSILNYIYALSNAVLLFITAQIMISLLFVIGPLFFIFLLFNQTKDMFDNWLKALVSNGLQIVFLITTLAFFNMLMVEVLKMALSYKVCWDDAWVINLGIRVTLTKFWTIPTLPPRTNMSEDLLNTGSPDSIPSFFSIIYIWIISSLTTSMITFMTNAAAVISEGIKASEVGSGIKALAAQAKNGLVSTATTQIWNKTVGGALDKLDNKLFNSGKTAKNQRANNEKQADKDMSNRASLSRAATEAEQKFKRDPENVKSLMGKSQEDQKKILQKVRQDAMEKRGEKLGLNKSEVEKLAKDTGLKYYGTNVFGALFKGATQAIYKGGSLTGSVEDKVNTKLTRKEAVNAMSNMTQKDRIAFAERIAKGDINVSNKLTNKLKKNPLKVGFRGLKSVAKKINDKVNPFNSDYNKAARQLEDQGKISISKTDFGRNDKERAMIRDQVKKNREAVKKLAGKDNMAIGLLKKGRENFKQKIADQKNKLKNLVKENPANDKLNELEDVIERAEYINDENSNEVMEEFAQIDNLNDNDKIDKFMEKDIVQIIKNTRRDGE